jgi:hypothetical protein
MKKQYLFPTPLILLLLITTCLAQSRPRTVTNLQCHLRADQFVWQGTETPKFIANVPPPGLDDIWLNVVQEQNCQVEIDGDWYQWIGPQWYSPMFVPYPSDWLAKNRGYLRVTLNRGYWQNSKNKKSLQLTPGEHTIRLAWAGREQKEESETPIQVLSNPVKIKILPSAGKERKLTPAQIHRKRVTDSFHLFRQTTPSEKEEDIGFNLRFFGEGYPVFTWQDIPILLELAQSDKVLRGRTIPKLVISSYLQRECREGMIALWLIEGLRRRQAEQTVAITVGKKLKSRPYHLPLNPMCVQKKVKLADSENSAGIHQQVLDAYQTWWQQVKDLPPVKAAQVYPLQDTNIRWFGDNVSFPSDNPRKIIRTQLQQKKNLTMPEPGPENQGLRLRLTIETNRKNGQDYHTVRIGILNVSSQPITLIANPIYDQHNKDYAAYLKAVMTFITFPKIIPPSAQTAGAMVTSPPVQITIQPQQEFKTHWQSRGGLLKNTDYYNTTPYLPGPGLYSIRAQLRVNTKTINEIPLNSNEQTVSIGNSTAMPKHATARVTHIDPEKNTVLIDLGERHKMQVGDEFYCPGPFPNYWKLIITEVHPWHSQASVTAHANARKIDPLPPKLATAQLWKFPP